MAADTTSTESEADAMARHGITRMDVPQYHYRTWRYTKLGDAIAQAKREEAAAGPAT